MRGVTRFRAARGRVFRSLAERNYRRFFVGHSCSVVGTWMQRIGQDWLVLELTGSAFALGVSMVCQFLPVLVGGVWGGVVVDRVDTRRLLMVTQAAQALLAAALAIFSLTGTATLPIVYALAAGLGIVTVFDNPARHTFVAELVGEENIVNAQALNSLVNNAGRLVGPALAGGLIVLVGVGVTFVINAVSFIAVMIALWLMDVGTLRRRTPVPRAPGQAREGLRYVWHHPELRLAILLVTVVSVFGQNFRVVFPILATDVFGGDARIYGWLTAALGLGAVAGGFASAAAVTVTMRGAIVACAAFGVATLAIAVSPVLGVALGAVVLLGVTNMIFNTLARTLVQLRTTPEMRGRVMAIHGLVFLGGTPIGGPLVGWLCEWWGARVGLLVSGLACLVGAAAVVPFQRLARSGNAL
nr:MFS transporter [Jiangella mangrovi]